MQLIFRLSSFGDVVLSASVLEAQRFSKPGAPLQVDWLVLNEYTGLLEGHPKIRWVLGYERRKGWRGLKEWLVLVWGLSAEGYTEVWDLHRSLRTWVALGVFLARSLAFRNRRPFPRWKTVKKDRLRTFGYFLFHQLWPKFLRPRPWVTRFSLVAGETGLKPNFSHLLKPSGATRNPILDAPTGAICFVPSSRWPGKEWQNEEWIQLAYKIQKNSKVPVIVLGTSSDSSALKLVAEAKAKSIEIFDFTKARADFRTLAVVLKQSKMVISVDTGIAHLAQSLGVPVRVLFGPTRSDAGFGVWGENAKNLDASVGCSPCGKDGKTCVRFWDRYACMRSHRSEEVYAKTSL